MKYIGRENELAYLEKLRDKQVIKVITGIRRCGKSTLLKMYKNQLLKTNVNSDTLQHYNFERAEDNIFENWRDCYNHICQNLVSDKMNYILLDEPQVVQDYEKLLDALYVNEYIDLYVTGSNANMLSSDLATLLSGRYIEIHLTTFSYSEFINAQGIENKNYSPNLLEKYVFGTSFPQVAFEDQMNSKYVKDYIENIFATVFQKDILERYKIRDRRAFENVTKYVLAHIGSEISPSSISKALKQDEKRVDNKTVERYLEILESCYLLYKVNRFDIKGKQQLATLEKYYVADLGIRHLLVGCPQGEDVGHLLENVVYFELLRRGGKVWIGKKNEYEVDFVVQKPMGNLEYYQVAYTAKEESTLNRELKSLRAIKDNYPKTLLTTDEFEFDNNGINQLNIEKWLLSSS